MVVLADGRKRPLHHIDRALGCMLGHSGRHIATAQGRRRGPLPSGVRIDRRVSVAGSYAQVEYDLSGRRIVRRPGRGRGRRGVGGGVGAAAATGHEQTREHARSGDGSHRSHENPLDRARPAYESREHSQRQDPSAAYPGDVTETVPATTRIDRQFNGPNHSGNGGYVAGTVGVRVAGATGLAATVDLRVPPPLDRDLQWRVRDEHLDLVDAETVVAAGRPGQLDADDPIVAAVSVDEARAARDAYEGYHDHPFPLCFTCGNARGPGDGLQVFSGPLADGRMACTWTPHDAFGDEGVLGAAYLWAALDCPGGWAAHIKKQPMVLARMTAQLYRLPAIGEECIVIGALRGVERRKNHAATALYAGNGELLGRAEQIWITIDIDAFA